MVLFFIVWIFGFISGISYGDKGLLWAFIVLLITLLFGFLFYGRSRKVLDGIIGLRSEFKNAVILNEMWAQGVRSINDIVYDKKKGNIDHIAVSIRGIWVIETKTNLPLKKNHPLFEKSITQAHAEALKVKQILAEGGFSGLCVYPILAISDTEKIRFGERPIKGVYVIGSTWLKKIILNTKLGPILDQTEVDTIAEYLRSRNLRVES